jgi:hypothetical protein
LAAHTPATVVSCDGVPIHWNRVRIEIGLRRLQQRRADEAAGDEAPGGAVLGRDRVHEVGGLDAPGARHMPDHDGRAAGDMPADHLRDGARVAGHGTGAFAGADIDVDGLAGVEIVSLGAARKGRQQQKGRQRD